MPRATPLPLDERRVALMAATEPLLQRYGRDVSTRQIAEAAKFAPGLWLLNRVADIWLDASAALRVVVRAPDDYVAVHTRFFDLIEDGQGAAACQLMEEYLDRHDTRIIELLKVIA